MLSLSLILLSLPQAPWRYLNILWVLLTLCWNQSDPDYRWI